MQGPGDGKNTRTCSARALAAALLGAAGLGFIGVSSLPAHAAPVLTSTPLTWNVIGLDSNAPATGPDLFPVGTRICNTGDATATAVSTQMAWDSVNAFVNIDG